jgi:phosphate:Na+ symporter
MSPTLSLARDFAISPAMFTQLLGGIGLFLLGMLLLTDGLKAAAGDALKRVLVRFTGRPVSAFFSGLTLTALVQSSSATTLATIGFVSAGLLTFAQAIGIVIGGSVGTTTTGWLVSLLGLKLSVGKLALPFIGVGALMRLMLKGRASPLGLALAGFGLIFVGIDLLQSGMGGAEGAPDIGEASETRPLE